MKIVAYCYTNPLLDLPPDSQSWGTEVEQVYQDFGERLALKQLFFDCGQSPPSTLILRRLDELGDDLTEISDRLRQLESLGIEIITQDLPYSPSNLGSILPAILKNQQCRKLQAGHARNRLKVLPPPGKAPYGYRRGKDRYILDRSTAPLIKDFFERFLLFGSLGDAVRYLEKRYGKKIAISTAKKWLTSPVYRGDLLYKNQDIIADTHPGILSREEAAQIDRLLRQNSKLPTRSASAPRSLAGLVFCQKCQSGMTVSRVTRRDKKQEYLYLRPRNCPNQPQCKALAYQTILEAIIRQICQDLPPIVAQLNLPNLEAIKNPIVVQITQKKELLVQITNLESEGILDEETANLRRYKLRGEIAQLQGKLEQLPPGDLSVIVQAVSLPQFWFDLSESERRFYFREFIKRVEITHPETIRLIFVF